MYDKKIEGGREGQKANIYIIEKEGKIKTSVMEGIQLQKHLR